MIRVLAIAPLLFLLLVCAAVVPVAAQGAGPYPAVETNVTPTSGTVGDKFTLSVTATAPEAEGLSALPLIEIDEESTWTLLATLPATDAAAGGLESRTYKYTIAPFETGEIQLPRVAITYAPADGTTSNTALSEPLVVSIDSVLAGSAAGTNLREVKRPVTLPLPKAVVWSGAALLFLLVAVVAWLIWRRYSERLKKMLGGPLRPDEKALKELTQLESERLVEQKKLKEYYTRLSDTLREYLAAAYGVHAIDLTTNEMLRELDDLASEQPTRHLQEYKTAIARLTELLDEADLVKFARLMPDAAHCRRALQHGKDVVELTSYRFKPDEEEDAAQKKNAARPFDAGPPPPPPPAIHDGDARTTAYEGGQR